MERVFRFLAEPHAPAHSPPATVIAKNQYIGKDRPLQHLSRRIERDDRSIHNRSIAIETHIELVEFGVVLLRTVHEMIHRNHMNKIRHQNPVERRRIFGMQAFALKPSDGFAISGSVTVLLWESGRSEQQSRVSAREME